MPCALYHDNEKSADASDRTLLFAHLLNSSERGGTECMPEACVKKETGAGRKMTCGKILYVGELECIKSISYTL